jgi:hypothetical protein
MGTTSKTFSFNSKNLLTIEILVRVQKSGQLRKQAEIRFVNPKLVALPSGQRQKISGKQNTRAKAECKMCSGMPKTCKSN